MRVSQTKCPVRGGMSVPILSYAARSRKASHTACGTRTSTQQALKMLDTVNRPNLKYQYDMYHMQRMEGNLIATLREHIGQIGHIQVADSPGRHEPGTGEISYRYVLAAIDALGYQGYVGLE